ncbi:MAG: hypothetical protein Q9213_001556 [Squamulea squamosa]
MWVLPAGRNLYDFCMHNMGKDIYPWRIGGEYKVDLMFLGKGGFNINYRMYWRTQFKQVSITDGIDRDAMGDATRAAKEMEKIEQKQTVG